MSLVSTRVARSQMFRNAAAFNADLSKWDTSSVAFTAFVFIASAVACVRAALVAAVVVMRPRFHIRCERD